MLGGVVVYRRFGTTYWSHPQGSHRSCSSWTALFLKMRLICWPETSVISYRTAPRNIPEGRRPQLLSHLYSHLVYGYESSSHWVHTELWSVECHCISLLLVTINYPEHGFQDSKITLRKGIKICQSGHIYVHIIRVLLLLLVSITNTRTATVALVTKWILFEGQDLEELHLPSSYYI